MVKFDFKKFGKIYVIAIIISIPVMLIGALQQFGFGTGTSFFIEYHKFIFSIVTALGLRDLWFVSIIFQILFGALPISLVIYFIQNRKR